MEDASCFAQVAFSLLDSATRVFRSLAEEVSGVRKDKRLQWIEEGGKELHFAHLGFMAVSYRRCWLHDNQSSTSPSATCSNPLGPSAYLAPLGGLTSRSGLEGKPSHQVTCHFPYPICTTEV